MHSVTTASNPPCWRVSCGVERDVVAAVADERRVEKVADEDGSVDGLHGGAQTGRRRAADVMVHGVQRVRHCVDRVHDEAEL